MEWLIFLTAIIASLFLVSKGSSYGTVSRYKKKETLFTPAERSFLGILDQAVSDKYSIFGKVRVADVLSPAKGMSRKNWQVAFNKISSKHFDYILCDKDTLAVVAVIELDDKSHSSKKAVARDRLLESACDSASLKLIRFAAKSGYQVQSVRDQLEAALSPVSVLPECLDQPLANRFAKAIGK